MIYACVFSKSSPNLSTTWLRTAWITRAPSRPWLLAGSVSASPLAPPSSCSVFPTGVPRSSHAPPRWCTTRVNSRACSRPGLSWLLELWESGPSLCQVQSCALLNWKYFRFRCGCTPFTVNWFLSLFHHFFAIFKNVVHSLEPGETPSYSASRHVPNYAQRS